MSDSCCKAMIDDVHDQFVTDVSLGADPAEVCCPPTGASSPAGAQKLKLR